MYAKYAEMRDSLGFTDYEVALKTGIPLNQRAIARRYAAEIGKESGSRTVFRKHLEDRKAV